MSRLSPAHTEALTRAAIAMGDLRPMMHKHQLRAWRMTEALPPLGWAFLLWSRRGGKTRHLVIDAHMVASRAPRQIIRYACPTKTHARTFIIPEFEDIAAQIPARMRPAYNANEMTYTWPNGSRCIIGSCETRRDCEVQKGTSCHRAYVEEAGVIDGTLLDFTIGNVLTPQMMTTRGVGIVVGTPPEVELPNHSFWMRYARCESQGRAQKVTLPEVDHIPEEIKLAAYEEFGGIDSPKTRREYFCEREIESDRLIVPEWKTAAKDCVKATERPTWLDWYVAGDFGFEDLSVVLWGWYDFAAAQLVIERELAMHQASGLDVGFEAKRIEAELGISKALRVADAPPQMLADLVHPTHGPGIAFGPAIKDDAEAALNQLRMLVQRKRIRIHPDCKTLISHLQYGTWNERRTSFDRAPGYGHWDAIDALKYMSRVVNWTRNPTPNNVGVSQLTHQTHAATPSAADSFRAALSRRSA